MRMKLKCWLVIQGGNRVEGRRVDEGEEDGMYFTEIYGS